MIHELRPDAKRLLYLLDAGAIEGFAHVEKDVYQYASELAERGDREEPNRMDELNAVRLLIDAAMAADESETVTLAANDFDALSDRLAQPGEPCPDVARVLSTDPPWEDTVSGWQPIDTAPKDETPILGFADGEIAVVEWYEEDLAPAGGYWSLTVCGSFAESGEWWPTHWQPLPEPPASSTP